MSIGPTGPKGGFGAQGFRGEKGSIGPTGPSIDPAIINSKAPLNNPKFTGTVQGISQTMVGLGNVDNTSDADKQISTATQNALDLKAPIDNPKFTGTVEGVTKAMVGLGNVDNTSDVDKPVSQATKAALDFKAPLDNPKFTGTVEGVTKAMVELGNVDNTSDVDKEISTKTQTALNLKANSSDVTNSLAFKADKTYVDSKISNLVGDVSDSLDTLKEISQALDNDPNLYVTLKGMIDLKAPINNPKFTGTVEGVTKAMVELGNVDNTSDLNKEISTATQTALNLKAPLASPAFSTDVSINGLTFGKGNNNIDSNTAGGLNVLKNNTTGTGNSAFGVESLKSNQTGNWNTSFGYSSLVNNISGSKNTSVGFNSLTYNTSSNNTAIGQNSLWSNTSGSNNTALGNSSGMSNTTGLNNTYIGYNSDCSGNNLTNSTAIGANAKVTESNQIVLGGNNSGYPIVNIPGTLYVSGSSKLSSVSTSEALQIKGQFEKNKYAMNITDDTSGNFISYWPNIYGGSNNYMAQIGDNLLYMGNNDSSGTSSSCVITKWSSVCSGLRWDKNTRLYLGMGGTSVIPSNSIIFNAVDNTDASANSITMYTNSVKRMTISNSGLATLSNGLVVGTTDVIASLAAKAPLASPAFSTDAVINGLTVGKGSGNVNTNTSIGLSSLSLNQTGYNNTAVGYHSLTSNTIGSANIANGSYSLRSNTTGNYNTANGSYSLQGNTTGSSNTANGFQSLYSNTTGSSNTANGFLSLYTNKGSFNTTLGYFSGYNNNNNSNNTYLGANADCSGNNLTNSTAIGANAKVTKSYQIVLGDASVTEVSIPGTAAKLFVGTTDVIASINSKANLSDLELKANLSDLEAKANLSDLAAKANLSDLAAKADITYVEEKISDLVGAAPQTLNTLKEISDALNQNANLSTTLTTLIGEKADFSYVTTALESKANLSDLESKANLSDLELKANLSDLAAKANLSDLEAKANLSDLAAKANSSDVTTALESKANSSDLESKANLSDLAAKADITVKAINSDNDLDLSGCYPINLSNGTCMLINNFPTILPNLNGAVYAMCIVGRELYIGGDFTTVRQTNGNILTVNRICIYNTLDGTYSAMGSGVGGTVNALCVMGGTDLYIGGTFIIAGGITATNICKYSLSANEYSAMGNGVNNTVNALCAIGPNLYIGGSFLTYNNNDGIGNITVNRICSYNTTSKFTNMGVGVDNIVYALCNINFDLYIGGAFTTTNGNIATYGICKYNTSSASFSRISATSNSTGVAGTVFAMCPVENTDIYVGGNFMSFNNATTNIAAYFVCKYNISSSTFSVLAGSGSGFAAQVRTLSFVGTDLYIGGDFQFFNNGTGNISANRICKYNPSSRTFSSVFTISGNNGVNNNVRAISFVGNNIYIGGNFTFALGVSCGYFFYMKSLAIEIKYNNVSLGFMLNNTFEPITSMTYNNKKYITFMGSKYVI